MKSLLAQIHFNGFVNLGTGQSISRQKVIDLLKEHFPGLKAKELPTSMPFQAFQADTHLLQKLTGWIPSFQLEEDSYRLTVLTRNSPINKLTKTVNLDLFHLKYFPKILCSSQICSIMPLDLVFKSIMPFWGHICGLFFI